MSKRYTRLVESERYHICMMREQGYSKTAITRSMGPSGANYVSTEVNAAAIINKRSGWPHAHLPGGLELEDIG